MAQTAFYSAAQPFTTIFGVDSTKWDISFCNLDLSHTVRHIAKSETIINGVAYKKVGTIADNSIIYYTGASSGFVREDTTSGRAWFRPISGSDNQEFLVMDLSLNLNDTFIVHGIYNDSTITKVDSIYTFSGRKHVRTNFIYEYNRPKLVFIEGIGTNYGFSYMHDPMNRCPCLETYHKDNSGVYGDLLCPISWGSGSGIDGSLESKNSISIFPHPISSSGVFKFENLKSDKAELKLLNSLGQNVETFQTNSDQFDITNKMNLSGIYFYTLVVNEQFVTSGIVSFIN